jgi:hypothetical protein
MQNFMLKKNLPLNIRSNIQENGHNKNKSKKIRGSLKKTDRLNSRPSTPHTFFFLKGRKREWTFSMRAPNHASHRNWIFWRKMQKKNFS